MTTYINGVKVEPLKWHRICFSCKEVMTGRHRQRKFKEICKRCLTRENATIVGLIAQSFSFPLICELDYWGWRNHGHKQTIILEDDC